MLALLVADITNPHHFGLVRGAEAQARAAGYTLVLGDTQGSHELEADHLDRLGSAMDGFVLASSRLPEPALQALLGRRPVVLFNREADGFPSVVTDSDGRQPTGRRAPGRARPPPDRLPGRPGGRLGRRAALAGAVPARRPDAGSRSPGSGPFAPTVEHGSAAADVALAGAATALVAFNDLLAIGVLRRLERLGVRVPEQVSVVGFDDIFGSDFCHPPLTTVTSPVEEAGRALIDLLLGTRAGHAGLVLPTPLRVRDSTGAAPRA